MSTKQINIIKIGGNVIDNPDTLAQFLTDFAQVKGLKILVHGGGKLATKMAEGLHIPQQMIDGKRITDAETLKIATMVYAGYINKNMVTQLQKSGCNAIGLSGADGNAIQTVKRPTEPIDFGFVGDMTEKSINTEFIEILLNNALVPVFCAITHDANGQLLNTNADTIAQSLAVSLSEKYDVNLIYSFEKKGVLINLEDDNSFIPEINYDYFLELKEKGIINKGMLPKLQNAFTAIEKGVRNVFIIKEDAILSLLNKNSYEGTRITNGTT